jgi:FKBP-type peptidyl-prolyl cis-trans isomerase SlyD
MITSRPGGMHFAFSRSMPGLNCVLIIPNQNLSGALSYTNIPFHQTTRQKLPKGWYNQPCFAHRKYDEEKEYIMETPQKPPVVADDVVVSLDYTLTVDGEVVDSTAGIDPISFLQGHENIIPGLESQLYGLKVGEKKKVYVLAKEAYGEVDPEAIVDVPRSDIPKDIPVKKGVELQVSNEDGELLDAVIVSVSKESVRLDFNHPLAGKNLNFEVTVVDLRHAEPEELEHGHVHGDDDEEDEDEYEEDFEEEFLDELDEDEDDHHSNGTQK